MNAEQRQVAADLWTKPTDLSHKPACRQLKQYVRNRHLSLLNPRADYAFYHPTEGRRLSRRRWLAIYPDGLPVCKQSLIQVLIGLNVDYRLKGAYSSYRISVSESELRGVTCHMESHSVTCYPTQVNAPLFNHSQAGEYSIYLPRRDGRLS